MITTAAYTDAQLEDITPQLSDELNSRNYNALGTDIDDAGNLGIWVADAEGMVEFVTEDELRTINRAQGLPTHPWRAFCGHGYLADEQEHCGCSPVPAPESPQEPSNAASATENTEGATRNVLPLDETLEEYLTATEIGQAGTSLPDPIRRRVAFTHWLIEHPELETPYQENHRSPEKLVARWDYLTPEDLCALYRALDIDSADRGAVYLEGNGLVMEGWIGSGWQILARVPFSEWADTFCSKLSASDNPARYLEIVAGLHGRADDEG